MAYSDNFPAVRPVFQADFANGGRIDPRASFTRASTANVFDGSKHESSQNLVLQSQSYDTTWTTYHLASSGALTGSQSAPDGTTTAWLVTSGVQSSGSPFVSQPLSGITSSTEYTVSAYVKAGTASHGFISLRGNSGHVAWAEIDFASPLSPTSGGANFTSISATSTAVGSGGWHRLTLTCTTSTVVSAFTYAGPSDGTNPNNNGYPVWNCNGETIYVWGHQIEERGSATVYNATTTQIHRQYASSLVSKANDIGRFEVGVDGQSAGTSLGCLIEGQSTNLATYSDDLTVSFWTSNKANQDNIADVAVGPTGALADMLKPTTATGSHFSQSGNVTTVASSTYTFSAYVKSVNGYRFRLQAVDISPYAQFAAATFTLTGAGSADVGAGSATITQLSNGWYRVSVTGTAGTTTTGLMLRCADSTGALSFAGDGYSGIICTGVQFELGSHCSSLVSTSGASATRALDSLTMASSSLFDNGGGTLYAEASQNVLDTYNGVFAVSDGTGANTIEIMGNSSSFRGQVVNANSTNAQFIGGTITAGQFNKHALTFSSSEASYYVNGSEIGTTDSSVVVPTVSEIDIGNVAWSRPLNGHIRKVALYAEPISETSAAALTS